MGSQRSLLKSLSVRTSGKLHFCRSNKKHELTMGVGILVLKEGRNEHHYCLPCGLKFIANAQSGLSALDSKIRAFDTATSLSRSS